MMVRVSKKCYMTLQGFQMRGRRDPEYWGLDCCNRVWCVLQHNLQRIVRGYYAFTLHPIPTLMYIRVSWGLRIDAVARGFLIFLSVSGISSLNPKPQTPLCFRGSG